MNSNFSPGSASPLRKSVRKMITVKASGPVKAIKCIAVNTVVVYQLGVHQFVYSYSQNADEPSVGIC